MPTINPNILSKIKTGNFIVITGDSNRKITDHLHIIYNHLKNHNGIILSRIWSVERKNLTLNTIMTALFLDLSSEKRPKIPRKDFEQKLINLALKRNKPIALFCDDGHYIPPQILSDLRRFLIRLRDANVILSV